MKAYLKEVKEEVLELLRQKRSYREISKRTNVVISSIEGWAATWHQDGTLPKYFQEGTAYTKKAQVISNGYYPVIRKRYHSMKRWDKLNGREFGFKSPDEAIHYYLKDGQPRVCAYCGRLPNEGMVWGLDRLDSKLGHIVGNLVPCCGSHSEGNQLSCQASKSKYSLYEWLFINMARGLGEQPNKESVNKRVDEIKRLAKEISSEENTNGGVSEMP